MDVKTDHVTFTNCIFKGGTWTSPSKDNNDPSTGLLNTGAGNDVIVTDSEFYTAHLNPHIIDAIEGSNFTAVRVNVHDVTDGFTPRADDVTIVNSYVHDLYQYTNSPFQPDGMSHDDGVQIYGGTSRTLIAGNNFQVVDKNSALQTSQTTGKISDLVWVRNLADSGSSDPDKNGGCGINFGPKPDGVRYSGLTVIDSQFGRNVDAQFKGPCPVIRIASITDQLTLRYDYYRGTTTPIDVRD